MRGSEVIICSSVRSVKKYWVNERSKIRVETLHETVRALSLPELNRRVVDALRGGGGNDRGWQEPESGHRGHRQQRLNAARDFIPVQPQRVLQVAWQPPEFVHRERALAD